MLDPIVLETDRPDMRLRLQGPALTEGTLTGSAGILPSGDGWRVEAGRIAAEVRIVRLGADCSMLEGAIVNRSEEAKEVRFTYPPLFYHHPGDRFARIFNPTYGGLLEPKRMPFVVSYPGPASFCLTGSTVPGHALGVGIFNPEQRHITISHVPSVQDGAIRFYINRIRIESGGVFRLPSCFIKTGGDWGEAFAPYRDWIGANYARTRSAPDWFASGRYAGTGHAHCVAPFYPPDYFTGLWSFDSEGRPRTLEELKLEVDRACEEHAARGLVPLFYQFGWWKTMAEIKGLYMFDSVCGDYTEENALIREIIRYIHEKGARTYLYTNAISFGEDADIFRERPELFIRDRGGFPVTNGGFPMFMLCPSAPGIREYWDRALRFILLDLDADGVFLDQIAGGFPPQYCYDPAHGHEHPDTYGAEIVKMIQYIGSRARELKPDALISGELCHDVRSIYLDETHGRGYVTPDNVAPDTEDGMLESEPPEYYAFLKYLSPLCRSVSAGAELVMDGSPGQMDNAFYTEHRELFEAGFVPCRTSNAGVTAYLYGKPGEGAAVLAVRCRVSLPAAEVWLPRPLKPADSENGNTARANTNAAEHGTRILVEAGPAPRYYLLAEAE